MQVVSDLLRFMGRPPRAEWEGKFRVALTVASPLAGIHYSLTTSH